MKNYFKGAKLFILLIFPLACSWSYPEAVTERVTNPQEESGYEVFLLIGQSNMAGRGAPMTDQDRKVIEGVWVLNGDDVPEPATNPLNIYSTVRKGERMQHIGPGATFGITIARKTGKKVLLVVNALGETSIKNWTKDSPVIDLNGSIARDSLQLYSEAVRRAKEAMKYGELKAVIWHQGEGDRSPNIRSQYMEQLKQMVSDLREDLGYPDLPFVAGEIAYWIQDQPEFNEIIRSIGDNIENSGYVSADGLGRLSGDTDPHFSREGQLTLGTRYAEKILQMVYDIDPSED